MVINAYGGFLQSGTYRQKLPKIVNGNNDWSADFADFTNTSFSLTIGSAIGTATKVFVILEYTKTTD